MKLLAFTDIHANPDAFKRLKEKALKEKPDLLICCGDISNFGLDLDFSANEIAEMGIKTLMIPGNHETPKEVRELAEQHEFIEDLHHKFIEIGDYIFYGHGTKTFATHDLELELLIPKVLPKVKGKKFVFITHAPIYNTVLDKLKMGHNGNRSARSFVEHTKPSLVFCGDFHENFRKEDIVENCRIVNPGDDGMIIEVEK